MDKTEKKLAKSWGSARNLKSRRAAWEELNPKITGKKDRKDATAAGGKEEDGEDGWSDFEQGDEAMEEMEEEVPATSVPEKTDVTPLPLPVRTVDSGAEDNIT